MQKFKELKKKLLKISQKFNPPYLNATEYSMDMVKESLEFAFSDVWDYYFNINKPYEIRVENASKQVKNYAEDIYGVLYDPMGRPQRKARVLDKDNPQKFGHVFDYVDNMLQKVHMTRNFAKIVHRLFSQEHGELDPISLDRLDYTKRQRGSFTDEHQQETSGSKFKTFIYEIAINIIDQKRNNMESQKVDNSNKTIFDSLKKLQTNNILQWQVKYSLNKEIMVSEDKFIPRDEYFQKILDDITKLLEDPRIMKSFGNEVSPQLFKYIHETVGWLYSTICEIFFSLGYYQSSIDSTMDGLGTEIGGDKQIKTDKNYIKLYQRFIDELNSIIYYISSKKIVIKNTYKEESRNKIIGILDNLQKIFEDKIKEAQTNYYNVQLDESTIRTSSVKYANLTLKNFFIQISKELYNKIEELKIIAANISIIMESYGITNNPLPFMINELKIQIDNIIEQG